MQLHPLFYWRRKSSAMRRRYEQPCRYHLRKVLVAGNECVTWQLKKRQRNGEFFPMFENRDFLMQKQKNSGYFLGDGR